ncbi:uncharacterized protein [Arachis hypogaea]|uniref:uncharacterized protein isoform X2 n=2 Tax=Arachis hypogaea TaxID=3818 RepID=UPI0010FC5C63|nr:uncharacterized protein LOC112703343 isoform X2 [Arachis hypogaea]XP_029143859.1 uncharacterized protein LOC112703343 isoform X2 [Arachis hypogaea]XP_029143860.1 uncharacterized protein LOC112703343 isoform X2 [Arachis hypogaea]
MVAQNLHNLTLLFALMCLVRSILQNPHIHIKLYMIAASFSFPKQWLNKQQEFKQQQQLVVDKIVAFEGRNLLSDEANKENLESHKPSSSLIKILETEFECLPGYMKGLVTWEEEIKEMEREQIREEIDEFGILYSELSDSNRSEGSNGSFAFLVLKLGMDGKPCKYA